MDLGVMSLASSILILIWYCTDLNTVERFCLRSFIFHRDLDFQRSCIFLHTFVAQNCFLLHDSCSFMSDGRIFLQERREAAELLWPYLEGHTTAEGQLLTPVTHSPLSIPEWKENLHLTVWDCLGQIWYFSQTLTITHPTSTETCQGDATLAKGGDPSIHLEIPTQRFWAPVLQSLQVFTSSTESELCRKLWDTSTWRRWCILKLRCWNHLLAMSAPFTPLSHLLDMGILWVLLSIPSSHKVKLWFLLFFETSQLSYWAVGTQPPSSFLLPSSIPLPSICSVFQHASIVCLLIAAYMFKLLFPSRCITWRYWIPTLPFPPLSQNSDSGLTKAPVLL